MVIIRPWQQYCSSPLYGQAKAFPEYIINALKFSWMEICCQRVDLNALTEGSVNSSHYDITASQNLNRDSLAVRAGITENSTASLKQM